MTAPKAIKLLVRCSTMPLKSHHRMRKKWKTAGDDKDSDALRRNEDAVPRDLPEPVQHRTGPANTPPVLLIRCDLFGSRP